MFHEIIHILDLGWNALLAIVLTVYSVVGLGATNLCHIIRNIPDNVSTSTLVYSQADLLSTIWQIVCM